jgi:hypothetical protein
LARLQNAIDGSQSIGNINRDRANPANNQDLKKSTICSAVRKLRLYNNCKTSGSTSGKDSKKLAGALALTCQFFSISSHNYYYSNSSCLFFKKVYFKNYKF